MKKKLLLLLTILMATIFVQAQERYFDEVFDNVILSEGVEYGVNVSILPIILQQDTLPQPVSLLMDVYEPEGDTLSNRPLVILAHRGDFLPPIVNQSPYGTRGDSALVEMCKRFARRGFVAVSMDYRLGWNPLGSDIDIKKTVLEASYRLSQDMRTCVRYFRKQAAEGGNTFRVNPDQIAMGGFDAAGYGAENVAFLKSVDQTLLPKFLDFSTMPPTPFVLEEVLGNPYATNEAILCIPNHPNYSSDVSAIIDFEGGLGDFSWIEEDDPPVIAFQSASKFGQGGIRDVTIGVGGTIIIADGAFPDTIVHRSQELGNQDVFIDAELDDELSQIALERNGGLEGLMLYHPVTMEGSVQCDPTPGVPETGYGGNTYAWNWYDEELFALIWDNIPGQTVPSDIFICSYNTSEGNPNDPVLARQMIDTLQAYIVPRLVLAMGLNLDTKVDNQLKKELAFQAFPNPTTDMVQLKANEPMRAVEFLDMNGRLVKRSENIDRYDFRMNTTNLPPGIYIAKVRFDQGLITQKIVVE